MDSKIVQPMTALTMLSPVPTPKEKHGREHTTGSSETAHPLIKNVLVSKPPIAELIGFSVEEISEGQAVGSLQAGSQHANPMGTLHGGVLCDVADAAMGIAFAYTLAG